MTSNSRAFDAHRQLGRTASCLSKDYNHDSRNFGMNASQAINKKISTESIKDLMDSKSTLKNFSQFSKQKKVHKNAGVMKSTERGTLPNLSESIQKKLFGNLTIRDMALHNKKKETGSSFDYEVPNNRIRLIKSKDFKIPDINKKNMQRFWDHLEAEKS